MENRKLFQKVEILCECCGKNLLEKDSMGIHGQQIKNHQMEKMFIKKHIIVAKESVMIY